MKKILIIVVSGKPRPSDRFRAQQQGANGYLVNPFAPGYLAREVRRFA